jgi:23S rRNA (adenine2503-C2)-methyltransferase
MEGLREPFFRFSRKELEKFLDEKFSLPRFRAEQLFNWVYKRNVYDLSQMTDISLQTRSQLEAAFDFSLPEIAERKISSDGTRKYLFRVGGTDLIEAVMIKQPNRMTLCVSSQVGCAMGCEFCRTATMKLKRHLGTHEIIGQVMAVIEDAKNFGDSFQNMVFMGMGEPLHNVDNVIESNRILTDPKGLGMAGRRITVSTSGLVPQIEKFGQAATGVSLAISLNSTTDEVRSKIMPVNKRYPIEVLLQTLREYPLKPRQTLTIEYVMLKGVNDSREDLKRLPKLLRGIRCKVNLIPYNTNADLGFECPSEEIIYSWQKELFRQGIETTVRWSKGKDIDAACGQLATVATAKTKKVSIQVLE